MRRSLVLTDESARHWFRASLPPYIRADVILSGAEKLWRLLDEVPDNRLVKELSAHVTRDDINGFVSVYVASFLAVLAFIA